MEQNPARFTIIVNRKNESKFNMLIGPFDIHAHVYLRLCQHSYPFAYRDDTILLRQKRYATRVSKTYAISLAIGLQR